MFNTGTLFASLLWGSLGVGYFIYGKRQRSAVPMFGGVALIGVSYFAGTVLVMSLLCAVVVVGIHVMLRRGY